MMVAFQRLHHDFTKVLNAVVVLQKLPDSSEIFLKIENRLYHNYIFSNYKAPMSLTKNENAGILPTHWHIPTLKGKKMLPGEVPTMALTKSDLVDHIHSQLNISRKRSAELLEGMLEITKKTLSRGEDVLISGFGKFCIRDKKSRRGRNPQTGRDLRLDQRRVVTFRCSTSLKAKINGKD